LPHVQRLHQVGESPVTFLLIVALVLADFLDVNSLLSAVIRVQLVLADNDLV
jgi:hypothetical protein